MQKKFTLQGPGIQVMNYYWILGETQIQIHRMKCVIDKEVIYSKTIFYTFIRWIRHTQQSNLPLVCQ